MKAFIITQLVFYSIIVIVSIVKMLEGKYPRIEKRELSFDVASTFIHMGLLFWIILILIK